MREIKFRAWHKKSKRMAYNVQNEYDTVNGVRFEGTDFEPGESCFASYLCNEEYSVMQFTGLKDKNGKEIYEGDIVSDGSIIDEHGCFHKAKVDFKYAGFVVEAINCKCGECAIIPLSQEADNLKVIGNIYENPELLPQEDSNEAK